MKTFLRTTFAPLCVAMLSACGGGGAADGAALSDLQLSDPLDIEKIQELTGSDAPEKTVAELEADGGRIFPRVDALYVSDFMARVSGRYVDGKTECSGTSCMLRGAGEPLPVSVRRLLEISAIATPVLTKRGITLFGVLGEAASGEARNYGGWLEHSGFHVGELPITVGEAPPVRVWYGAAGGELTGSPLPTGMNATWKGLMVGTPENALGEGLQGDADLTWTGGETLDAAFTNIVNVHRLRAHSTTEVRFAGVPLSRDGTFGDRHSDWMINGAFFGTDHVEAAGTFSRSGIIGAFGAKKE